ncbi:MAG: hypothetical protein KF808_00360 [Cryobacterium sp.]|nr:hypothetical protein [Cryobacterium sp.]
MITYKDTTYVFGHIFPGREHSRGRRTLPVLADDGSIIVEPGDGRDLIRVPVRRLLRNVGVVAEGDDLMTIMKAVAQPPTLFADNGFELIVTDSRLVLLSSNVDSDRSRVAGQIRFPWIRAVSFRPKQSFLNESEIVIEGIEEYDVEGFPTRERGTFQHNFTLIFDKRYHPGELAREITGRVACYLIDTQRVPKSEQLLALRDVPLLADPSSKGDHASYWLPTYCSFPGGDFGIDDDIRNPEWIEQSG